MTLPNFLIIGAAKSGTTALFRYLKQHPQIYMSPKKEPHYFSFDNQSKMTKGPGDLIPNAITDLTEYKSLFDRATIGSMVGEASTSYLYRPEAPARIHELLPEVKLIAILRNPVDRAFSAYMHLVRDNREIEPSFILALEREPERVRENWDPIWHYTNVGMYGQQLSRYFSIFKREQMLILLYDDFLINSRKSVKEVFEFLGIDSEFSPDTSSKMNVSGQQRNSIVAKLIKSLFDSPNLLRWLARKFIPETARWSFTETVRQTNLNKKYLSREDSQMLVEIFKNDILLTQELISMDLRHWLTF